MRPIWKGHISFGLVNIPVTLYPAEQRTELQLHMIDRRNHSRVRYQRINADTGEEVPWNDIVRGYEYDDGQYVEVSEEELKKAQPEATQTLDIQEFVELGQIDPMYFDKPYYLEPGKGGDKGYVLLREILGESGKAGIARIVIRTRQYPAALTLRGDALVVLLLRYSEELRSADDLKLPASADHKKLGVSPQELKMAKSLVEGMSGKWEPEKYKDEYRDTIMKWIEKKAAAGKVEVAPETTDEHEEYPAPINMMEALKRSMAQTKGRQYSEHHKRKPTRRKAG